jgi:hypothetical protein
MRMTDNYRVYWPHGRLWNVKCGFNDLFENEIEVLSIPPNAKLIWSWEFIVLPKDGNQPKEVFDYLNKPGFKDFSLKRKIQNTLLMTILRKYKNLNQYLKF